jgi:hypothetical protein
MLIGREKKSRDVYKSLNGCNCSGVHVNTPNIVFVRKGFRFSTKNRKHFFDF